MQAVKSNAQLGDDLVIDEQNIPYKMDSGLGQRARIGLIVLSVIVGGIVYLIIKIIGGKLRNLPTL